MPTPNTRFAIGCAVAAVGATIALAIAADIGRSFYDSYRYEKRINRVAPNEVQLDAVELTFSGGRYHLSGSIRNESARDTLREVTIAFVVEDCVDGACHQQAEGTAHVGCHVPPKQSARFSVDDVLLSAALSPRGERRLTSRVAYTVAE